MSPSRSGNIGHTWKEAGQKEQDQEEEQEEEEEQDPQQGTAGPLAPVPQGGPPEMLATPVGAPWPPDETDGSTETHAVAEHPRAAPS